MLGKSSVHFYSMFPITVAIDCKDLFTAHASKASRSLSIKSAPSKAKHCIRFDRIF